MADNPTARWACIVDMPIFWPNIATSESYGEEGEEEAEDEVEDDATVFEAEVAADDDLTRPADGILPKSLSNASFAEDGMMIESCMGSYQPRYW